MGATTTLLPSPASSQTAEASRGLAGSWLTLLLLLLTVGRRVEQLLPNPASSGCSPPLIPSSEAGLHTVQSGEAIIRHPGTGEQTWCNHVINFSVHGVQPADVRSALLAADPDWWPTDTLFADGDGVDAETVRIIRDAYELVAYRHSWRAGDVIVLDNRLMAHARDPFTGSRRVVVGMGARRTDRLVTGHHPSAPTGKAD